MHIDRHRAGPRRQPPNAALLLFYSARATMNRAPVAWVATDPNPTFSVRPNGAVHQWKEDPPRKLSLGPGS